MEDWKVRLHEARVARGLNKTEFARLVGVSNPTVTDWEKSVDNEGIKEITGNNLTKVCNVLGVDPQWLLHGDRAATAPRARYVHEEKVPFVVDPVEPPKGRAGEALNLKAETAAELRLLSVYRLANEDGRAAIDTVVEQIRRRLDVDAAGLNQR